MNKPLLILLLISTLLSSCALDTFEEKLVGTWVMVDVQCVTFGPPLEIDQEEFVEFGFYEFREDGTFVISNNQRRAFLPNGTYRWELREITPESGGPTVEKLYIDNFTFPYIKLETTRLVFSDVQTDGCLYEFRRYGYFK